MRAEFTCGDPAALAGYLYDECDTRERAAIDAHLPSCAACIAELAALGATRKALASWTPPDAKLGFRITAVDGVADGVHAGATVLRPARWWQRPLPAWAQAAAAIVIFASGALIGMRTGTTASAPVPPAAVQTASVEASGTQAGAPAGASTVSASTVSPDDLAALEERLRAEMSTLRAASAGAPAASAAGDSTPAAGNAAILQRVRALLAESEQRQQRELALRLAQLVRDVDTQRRMDLARIDRTFGQMEGYTRPELADQRDMINYLIQRTGLQRAPQ